MLAVVLARMRIRVLSSVRVLEACWFGGLAGLAGALLLALSGEAAIAIAVGLLGVVVFWLAGGFFVPGTSWAYYRRVVNNARDWQHQVDKAYRPSPPETDRLRQRLARLHPPPSHADAHARIIELLTLVERRSVDPALSYVERCRQSVEIMHRLRDERERVVAEVAATDAAYADALRDLAADSRRHRVQADADAERAITELISKLKRMRVPASTRGEHDTIVEIIERYRDALLSFQTATGALEAEQTARAAGQLESLGAAVGEAFEKLRISVIGEHGANARGG